LRKIYIPPRNILVYAFLAAFFGAFLGFIIFNKSLRFYEVSKAIVVRSTEPFFAAILALTFLHETINSNRIIGAVMIAAGVLLLSKKQTLSQKN
jgi:drug/metabolite transporter (DMT)-like permease